MENETVVRPGDRVRVQWGRYGVTVAVVSKINRNGDFYARRWRRTLRNWTGERKIFRVGSDDQGVLFDVVAPAAETKLQ